LDVAGLRILAVNSGSSSLKLGLFEVKSADVRTLWQSHGEWDPDNGRAADALRPLLEPRRGEIGAVGHRVVHGGPDLRKTTRLTPEVRSAIARAGVMDPEHSRLELAAIDAIDELMGPETPQAAVFDTAFFTTLEPPAYVYPLPYAWCGQGIRRYGFHGTSHQYVARRAAEMLGRRAGPLRLITCHLGNGCSLAAVRDGKAVDTTMGFTPLEGLMMGTRSGSVDPGILIYLLRHGGYSADDLDRVLNEQSGLKGVSGISGDMRKIIHAIGQGEARARLAFEMFVHRLCREIGGMLAVLGGMEAIVFTGGIGENTPEVRAWAAEAFGFLGVRVDADRNENPPEGDCDLALADSPVRVLRVRTKEEEEIARETAGVLVDRG
jgi:acetate kinase